MSNYNHSIGISNKTSMTERKGKSDQFASWRMELSTKENGLSKKTIKIEEEFKYGLMEVDMTDSGETEWPMGRED